MSGAAKHRYRQWDTVARASQSNMMFDSAEGKGCIHLFQKPNLLPYGEYVGGDNPGWL
jgi:hypothetical protein